MIHALSLGKTWHQWITSFTPEEYNELVVLQSEQPLGVNRLYYYLSNIILTQLHKSSLKIEDLMFEEVGNDIKIKRLMSQYGINRDS